MIRDDRQRAVRLKAIDAPHARVVGMAEVHQPRRPFAQRELERRNGGQRRTQPQNLQQLAGRGVGGDRAIADAVGKERDVGAINWRRCQIHRRPVGPQCNPWTMISAGRADTAKSSIANKSAFRRPSVRRHSFTAFVGEVRKCKWRRRLTESLFEVFFCTARLHFPEERTMRFTFGRSPLLAAGALTAGLAFAPLAAQQPQERIDYDAIYRIKDEGFRRSRVMEITSWLTDVYGP